MARRGRSVHRPPAPGHPSRPSGDALVGLPRLDYDFPGMPIRYQTLPVPAFDAFTARIPAGAVTFGVEYRHLDEAGILAYYGPDARAQFDHKAPAGLTGPVEEDGLCIHVFAARDGAEYLRFDCFDEAAHYHLLDPALPTNLVFEHDVASQGPLLDWALRALRDDLPALLEQAGASELARALNLEVVARALVLVERECTRALAAGAPIRAVRPPAKAPASPR